MEVKKFIITFGQKYRQEKHPQDMHPDGWFTIYAVSEERAREVAFEQFGDKWSNIYASKKFDPKLYRRGEIAFIYDKKVLHKS